MPGTKSGGKKAALTIKEIYGRNFYREIGTAGGRVRGVKGFAVNPELARIAGAKGGRISRRSKKGTK
ncbi:hypothetical protein GCM10009570_25340 [Dietzia natronolimnaea]